MVRPKLFFDTNMAPRRNLWVSRSVEQGWGTKLVAGEGTASKPVGARGAAPSPAMADTL